MDPKEAQKARSKKYGIAVREGGHVTKPSEWANVPDDQWLDPVNYDYPCPDAGQTAAAARYWGKPKDKAQYSEADQAIIDKRLTMMEKMHKMGEGMQAADSTGQRQAHFLSAVGDPSSEDYGYEWDVQVTKFGPGVDGRINWVRGPLVAALPMLEGAKVFLLNDSQHIFTQQQRPGGKSAKEIVGWLSQPTATDVGINARFHILKSAKWLRDTVLDSVERGNPGLLGLSLDADGARKEVMVAGKKMIEPTKITSVEVDVVYSPTNEGKFLKMVAAAQADQKEDNMFRKMLAAMKTQRPDLAGRIDALLAKDEVTDEEMSGLLAAAMPGGAAGVLDVDKLIAAMKGDASTSTAQAEAMHKVQLQACSMLLSSEMKDSGLPKEAQEKLTAAFTGKVFEAADLTASIKAEKEYLDKLTAAGRIVGAGDPRIVVVGEPDRLQAALDRMFAVKVDEKFKDVPAFGGLRAAYVKFTGDTDIRGVVPRERLTAAFDSSTFAYALGNTLYRRMIQDYGEIPDFGVKRLISTIRNAKDFRTLESVRIAYFGDLPDVDPEAADYADLGTLSDEEISYALNQKGGLVIINRKMIVNDDLGAVTKIISRVPRAARRTFAKRIWNKFINNATYKGDSKAVFHADHGNLDTVAYSIASALAMRTAMMKQTEPGSGERLNLKPVTVAFPTDLFGTVTKVNTYNPTAAVIDDANPMFNFFKPEGLIEVPFMTDVTDFMMFADPAEVEIIEVAYLNGQQEPEMFVQDNPTVGQVFTGDKITYKIRHEYECEIADYRGCAKNVVAG